MIENVKIENIRIYHDGLTYCELEKAVQGLSEHYWFPFLHKRVYDNISVLRLHNMFNHQYRLQI